MAIGQATISLPSLPSCPPRLLRFHLFVTLGVSPTPSHLTPLARFTSVLLFAFTIPFFGVGYMAQAVFRTRVRRRKSATRRAYLESMLAPRTAAVAAALRSATSISSGSTSFSVDHSGISHDLSEAQTP